MEIFYYDFFRNAVAGVILLSIASAVIGTYIVTRRLVSISGGVTHACSGGLGLGYFLGLNPVVMAAVFAVGSSLGVQWMSRRHRVREDSAIAVVWALGMALGTLFIFLTPGYVPELNAFLFGNILTITRADLWAFAIFTAVLLIFVACFFRKIVICALRPRLRHREAPACAVHLHRNDRYGGRLHSAYHTPRRGDAADVDARAASDDSRDLLQSFQAHDAAVDSGVARVQPRRPDACHGGGSALLGADCADYDRGLHPREALQRGGRLAPRQGLKVAAGLFCMA